MPGGVEHAVRPQSDLLVARLPGEPHALVDQAFADAQPTRARLDQQQAQLRHRLRLFDEEHGANDLAAAFSDPAPLALRVVVPDEFRRDLRDQRLELFIPTVLFVVEDSVPMRDPAHVAWLMLADDVRNFLFGLRAERLFDNAHRFDQAVPAGRREFADQRFDLAVRIRVEFGEGLPPFLRQPDEALPPVGFRGLSGDQAALFESTQQAAEITRVQPQLAAKLCSRRLFTLRQFVNDPGLGQGKRTFQYVIVKYADLLRIEAIEAPHRLDARREAVFGHECPPLKQISHCLTLSAIYLILSSKW